MKTATLEEFLGRLYADARAQARFRANPLVEAKIAGLSEEECGALMKMDWGGFDMACKGFQKKRQEKMKHARNVGIRRVWSRIGQLLWRG